MILYTSELSIQWAVKRWNFSLVLHLWFSFSVLILLNGLKFLTRDSFLWILKTFGFQSPRRKKILENRKKSKTKLAKEWKEFCLGPRLVLVKGIRVCRECSPSLLERSVNCYSKGLERERARKQEERRFFFPTFVATLTWPLIWWKQLGRFTGNLDSWDFQGTAKVWLFTAEANILIFYSIIESSGGQICAGL